MSTEVIRRRLFYSGNVQGVGFRYTSNAVAARFPVTGYVRNLRDGRVELVAEGAPAVLDRFQSAIGEAMGGNIEAVEASETTATCEFKSFSIAH